MCGRWLRACDHSALSREMNHEVRRQSYISGVFRCTCRKAGGGGIGGGGGIRLVTTPSSVLRCCVILFYIKDINSVGGGHFFKNLGNVYLWAIKLNCIFCQLCDFPHLTLNTYSLPWKDGSQEYPHVCAATTSQF